MTSSRRSSRARWRLTRLAARPIISWCGVGGTRWTWGGGCGGLVGQAGGEASCPPQLCARPLLKTPLFQPTQGTAAPGTTPQSGPPGAVLVFMPGAPEIGRTVRALAKSPGVRAAAGGGEVMVLPLHGGLSPEAQAKAFQRPPPGGRKVVVATNVAETSVTIDDVTVVVDTGRVKEMR